MLPVFESTENGGEQKTEKDKEAQKDKENGGFKIFKRLSAWLSKFLRKLDAKVEEEIDQAEVTVVVDESGAVAEEPERDDAAALGFLILFSFVLFTFKF